MNVPILEMVGMVLMMMFGILYTFSAFRSPVVWLGSFLLSLAVVFSLFN